MKFTDDTLSMLRDCQQCRNANLEAGDFTLSDYLSVAGSPDLMLAYADLFFPSLVEFDGRWFLEERFSIENYRMWANELGNVVAAQNMANHMHIRAMVREEAFTDEVALEMARVTASIWGALMRDRGIAVEIGGEGAEGVFVTLFNP